MKNSICVVGLGLAVGACSSSETTQDIDPALLTNFAVLPQVMEADGRELTPARVDLGRILYYDTRFSKNNNISCNSCHRLDEGRFGVDNLAVSPGTDGVTGGRNAPTVYNAAGHLAQFWDGRAADVEAQAQGPVLNPIEMGMADEAAVLDTIRDITGYMQAFANAFPGEAESLTYENMGIAIGAFERGLVTPSPWDDFLMGDEAALTEEEKAGFIAFYDAGCASCHAGAYVGGDRYEKLGVMTAHPSTDPGRYEVTQAEADRAVFKVPSLRNIAETGPYYHDGSIATLDAAIRDMATYQLGLELSDAEVESIETFLNALTGRLPTAYVVAPDMPQ